MLRLELISMDTFVGLTRLERFYKKKFNPVFLTTLSFHLCQIVFLLFFRLKLSSNEITTLEFGAFNHLINIQKV